jgi:hypothetical protein
VGFYRLEEAERVRFIFDDFFRFGLVRVFGVVRAG